MRGTLFPVLAFTLTACSLFTSLDGLQNETSEGGAGEDGAAGDGQGGGDGARSGDGAGTDGSTSDGASDDSGPGGIFPNGSFEEGPGGCGTGWTPQYNCSIQRSSIARTGSSSCEVCPLPGISGSFALEATPDAPIAPGTYYGEAWLHEDPDAAVGNAGFLATETLPDAGMINYQAPFFPPTSTWTVSSETFTVDSSGTLKLEIHNYQAEGCFLVDDISVFAQ